MEVLREMWQGLGHDVTVALGGQAGWTELTRSGLSYDLVTLDLKMLEPSGPEIWERLRAAVPRLADRVVFVTGDTAKPATAEFLRRAQRPVLQKPLGPADLAAVLAVCCGPSSEVRSGLSR